MGRRSNIDPVEQIDISDYACFANNPIYFSDPQGDTPSGQGDPPTKDGTKEGEVKQTTYFPTCKECTEYKTEDWIWHKGGVNGSKGGWMSPEDYQSKVLKPVTQDFDKWVNSNFDGKNYTDAMTKYLKNVESSGGNGISALSNYSDYMKKNPTYDHWTKWLPIWGSYKQADLDYSVGKTGWGTFNTVLAISDVFLVKSILQAPIKAMFKKGITDGITYYLGYEMSHTYGASVARWKKLGLNMGGFKHHWFLSQELMETYPILKPIGNQTWNLTRFSSQASHMRWGHGQMYGGIRYSYAKLLYPLTSSPNWFKFGLVPSVGGRVFQSKKRR